MEVQSAVDQWAAEGGHTLMVTLTFSHRLTDPLEVGLEAAVTGWRNLTRGRQWRRLKARLDVAGFVRAVEVTWTPENGWHPHVHALLFAERALDQGEVAALESELFEAWRGIVKRLGARAPSRAHGVRITRGAADYVAKVQEHDRAGVEMTRFDLKRSRSATGVMPFELLDVTGDDKPRARRLWWEFVDATSGRRAITWSRGLKARFSLDDLTDEEVLDQTEADDLVLLVDGHEYDERLKNRPGRATAVLELVEGGELTVAARLAGGRLAGQEGAGPRGGGKPEGRPRRGAPPDIEASTFLDSTTGGLR